MVRHILKRKESPLATSKKAYLSNTSDVENLIYASILVHPAKLVLQGKRSECSTASSCR